MQAVAEKADFKRFEEFQVPVAGGELAVLRWPARERDAPVVVAAHGITANALAWAGVSEALAGRVTLVAPDMRGRAYSRAISGPFGVDADADDLIAVLDHEGADKAVLLGHSLGAYVASVAATRYPERVSSVVAADGGLGLGVPPDVDPDEILLAILGPALQKLSMRFRDGEDYLDFHRRHPAFRGNWTPQLTAYLSRDTLWLEDGGVASSCIAEAIRADGRELVIDERIRTAILGVPCPLTFLYAERNLFNEPPGIYTPELIALGGLDDRPDRRITITFVPGTNHYTMVAPGVGADAVADAVLRSALAEPAAAPGVAAPFLTRRYPA
jgi:pimeloyl-ACP methyl ester carboxylesterase